MASKCYICCQLLEGKSQKAKKLLLFEEAAKKYLGVLNDLSEDKFGGRIPVVDDECRKCYICNSCCGSIDRLLNLKMKVEEEKNKLISKLETLITTEVTEPQLQNYTSTPRTSRKRSSSSRELSSSILTVPYETYKKTYTLSPFTEENIKRMARKSYRSLSTSLLDSDRTGDIFLLQLLDQMKKEMKHICSTTHNSVLRDSNEAVRHFSWDVLSDELWNNAPTLITVLSELALGDQQLSCTIASMLLKKRLPKMGLLQRAVSLLLYGNGTNTKNEASTSPVQRFASTNEYDEEPEDISNGHEDIFIETEDFLVDNEVSVPDDDSSESEIDDFAEQLEDTCSSRRSDENMIVQCSSLEQSEVANSNWEGFKIVGDNIDKNIRPSYERLNSHTISLHYFHSYAALDRIDLSGVSDAMKGSLINVSKLLPSKDDVSETKSHFSILISRILVQRMTEFISEAGTVVWHIPHERQAEMSKKSTVVPLGVILRNENKIDEMSKILDELHKYVPAKEVSSQNTLPNGESEEVTDDKLYQILIGGDQLTVARARSAIGIRRNHNTNKEKLQGLIPVVEDWHARVIFVRLMKVSSGRQRGTLMQLKNLLQATSVPKDPKQNVKATEDFLYKVLVGYIVAAAKEVLRTINGPTTVQEVSQIIIDRYVRLLSVPTGIDESDAIATYTSELITLLLLWEDFHDATREGDGKRVMMLWKFLLIVFNATNRYNYRIEAVTLLLQYNFLFSERKAQQLAYSRFINTHGRIGCNISCDLHLEHLNRRLKAILRNLQSNMQTKIICRAARSVGFVQEICSQFENETSNKTISDKHPVPSIAKDVSLIVDTLEDSPGILVNTPNRSESLFKINKTILEDFDIENLTGRIINVARTYL
uniref:DUF6589 domain-containing protein n=1 Tax=Amphimedon queenslandica TaxID=400682 RepID=A0A1X7VUI6_AMPQE